MATPNHINWKDLAATGKKEGNPLLTNPTRAMLYDLETPKYKTYLIEGERQDYYVEYDREYAVEWCKRKLSFIAGIPRGDREKFFSEVFGREHEESNVEMVSSTVTKSKKRNSVSPSE
jgi:hypothetical protein